ncbi:hypothetical protein ERO13_D11G299800v2 [Gossypium hirsutum]|nr:hypothetical protein ERO13_D11G299800v2 [Gossypium hirsutum]
MAIPHNLGNLSKLQYLDLRGNDLKSKTLQWVSGLSSLQYLDLSYADLHTANDWVQVTLKLPSLLELHLSGCGLDNDPSSINVNSTKSLVVLDLSGNSLSSVPKWIFSLHGLVSIDLGSKSLEGPIPDYFGNISFLEILDLSLSFLNSSIPKSLYSLNRLQFLSLWGTQLQGTISSAIGNLSSLIQLYLAQNQLNGQIPLSIGELSSLKLFHVSENQLNGQIPLSIGELSSLKLFDVSKNKLNGQIPLSIGQLSSLEVFDVSENQLNGTFPLSFGRLESLETLDCGYNLLEGVVSETHFSNLTRLTTLAASHNRLRFEPNSSWIPLFQCERIELGHWHLGPKFPQWLKFQKKLSYLDISYAGISDVMPAWFLNLPTPFESLNLSSNQLRGDISYLNLYLVILSLRSNNFDGHIPHKICDLQFLQNLDLAHNNISRVIPKCFNNLSAMAITNKTNNFVAEYVADNSFFLNALLVLKGREDEYGSTLGLVTSMDLSANSLTGEIPKEIGSLVGLLSLNFSGNLLTGNIPDSIGKMELMESLDLSMNRLNGEIPPSFSNLNFLNHFNESYNNLTGQIPTSTQLQSFENLSYVGNHLCGLPLTKNCTSKGNPIVDVANNGRSREGSKVNWLYVSIVLGFVMGFWVVVAPLFFIRSWRHAYYRKLDHVGRKLYVSWATMGM